ncbi:MAG: hypothetical protein KAQ67_13310, partial [Gammaproteobacteria bacterium]|nr:hypothetical protein [Gammaproteobacteria bacterium]
RGDSLLYNVRRIGFDLHVPSRCLPCIVSIKGKSAMDGGLSAHEQGCECKRPVSEVKLIQKFKMEIELHVQCTGTRRANSVRAAFLGTFWAVAKSASPAGANTGMHGQGKKLTPCAEV